ncbi:MAG TPA: hypothetical protein DCG47_13830 [Spirochaetaceae bacterium]|nr:hypothetical protein [Spirochaetaceae bacterium]
MSSARVKSPHLYFILALLFIVLGSGSLLLTTGLLDKPLRLWPLMAFIIAVLYSYIGIAKKRYSHALFIGSFVACSALLNLIMGLVGVKIVDYWPLYAILAGICMVPSGLVRYKAIRASFLVPAVSFVLLGLFLAVFSFGFSSMSFKNFLSLWWPGLFVAAGLVLFVLWLITRSYLRNDTGSDTRA